VFSHLQRPLQTFGHRGWKVENKRKGGESLMGRGMRLDKRSAFFL